MKQEGQNDQYGLLEMKNNHAMASIENIFLIYLSTHGPSDLKPEECQFGTLGQFKMAAKIQDGRQNREFCWFCFI